MKIKNRDIRRIHAALTSLSARTLPAITSDLKVARLLRSYFNEPYQITEDIREKIIKDNPSPEEKDPSQAVIEARTLAFSASLLQEQDIKDIPEKLLLTEEDMPKATKVRGEENRDGLGDIIQGLGVVYKEKPEEET
jgi:hypothetical protein